MEICPIIEIFPATVSLFADSNGRVLLDIGDQTSVSLVNALKTQDDVLTIGSIPDLTLIVPMTAKNYFYLKSMYDPNTEKSPGVYMTARVTVGSETFQYDRMYAVNKGDSFEVKFTYAADWVDRLKNFKLHELSTQGQLGFLGLIDFTKDNVKAKWTNNAQYIDGDDGYWFPLVDYGGWREQQYHMAVVEDLRPFLHTLYVMRKCFEKIGWCLEFPFYETELGRRCIDYLLKPDYGDSDGLRNLRRFDAKKTYNINTVWPMGQIGNWVELYDPGNSFSNGSGVYNNVFEGKFKIRVTTTPSNTLIPLTFRVWKLRQLIGGGTGSIIHEFNVPLFQSPGDHTFEIETSVTPNESVYLEISSGNLASIVGPCTMVVYFSNEVTATYHATGDVINIANEIDPGISAWDYMLGNIHFCQGIVVEYPTERRVRILTPFNADIFGDVIEGYFNDTMVSLRSQQPLESTHSNARDQLRFITLAFAKTTDEFAKRLSKSNNKEYFSKTIDLGEPLINTEENRNPLFEYTLLQIENAIIHLEDIGQGSSGYYLPQLIDNEDNKISKKIRPRKLVAYGYDTQLDGIARIVFENELQTLIPFAAQEAKTLNGSDIEFGGAVPEMKLIYGDDIGDLWSMVLGRWIMQFRARLQMDLVAYFNHLQYFGLNLRNLFEIEYDGHPVAGRIIQVNDWQPCGIISAQVLLMPELTTDNYCLESPPDDNCLNDIFLNVEQLGDCYTFSIGGQPFSCNVQGIVWEIKRENEDWVEIGTGNTVQVCDEPGTFTVRATVTFDCPDCPIEYAARTINPCVATAICELTQVISNGQSCLQWSLDSEQPLETCSIIATLSIYVNGALSDVVILESGELYCPIDPDAFYILDVEIDCGGSCPVIVTQCTYSPGAPPPGPCQNFPVLECVPVDIDGVTCYEFVLTGQMSNEYEYFVVTIFCDGERFTWMEGDPPFCCSGELIASAMVYFCDCDPVCTDEISCEGTGCTIFNPGTAVPLYVCN